MMISVDGYFEGPNHDLSWHNVDAEFDDFAVQQLDEADTLVFGRRTYELMADYWPTAQAESEDSEVAKRMNSYSKIVFSRSLESAPWNNTKLFHDDLDKVITETKAQPGKDIAVLGSSNLCLSLIDLNLLDEVRLMVSPIALGQGTSLFTGIKSPLNLALESSRQFKSGNELLTYRVVKRNHDQG